MGYCGFLVAQMNYKIKEFKVKGGLINFTCVVSFFVAAQENDALSVARAWLETVDAGYYNQSYELTDTAFKSELSLSQWNDALDKFRHPLGMVVLRSEIVQEKSERLPGRPDGKYITIQFITKFEHARSAIETITLSQNGGDWRPVGYFIK